MLPVAFQSPSLVPRRPRPSHHPSLSSAAPSNSFRPSHSCTRRTRTVPLAMTSSGPNPSSSSPPFTNSSSDTVAPSSPASFSSLFSSTDESDVVYDASGASLSLCAHVAHLNAQGKTVVLGWLRHYGCTLCMKQAADWKAWLSTPHIRESLATVLIGNGPVSQIDDFAARLQWPDVALFTDPKRTTYTALEFTNKKKDLFNVPALMKTMSSFKEHGQKLTIIPTDPFQQGGAIVVDPSGTVKLFRPDKYAGDHVDKDTLLQTLDT